MPKPSVIMFETTLLGPSFIDLIKACKHISVDGAPVKCKYFRLVTLVHQRWGVKGGIEKC